MAGMIDWLWMKTAGIASWTTFGVVLVIAIAFNTLFNRYGRHYPKGLKTFDGRMSGFTPSQVEPILKEFHDSGQLDRYLAQETQLDLIYPLVYSLLFAIIIAGAGARLPHWFIVAPYAAALFDYCENFTYIALILRYRAEQHVPFALAVVASVASRLKWGFIFLSLGAALAALSARLR